MSSNDSEDAQDSKKRRQRACDMCRRKKRRCDGGDICNHCIKRNFPCTYVDPAAIRGTQHFDPSIIVFDTLERHLESAQNLPPHPGSFPHDPAKLINHAMDQLTHSVSGPPSEDQGFIDVTERLQALSLTNTGDLGFQGKSSTVSLVTRAIDIKGGGDTSVDEEAHPAPESWMTKPWEDRTSGGRTNFSFPENDLMMTLVSLYFENTNPFLPLLHQHMFEQRMAEGLHLHNSGFASTLLLVCAIGSVYSEDPRTFNIFAPPPYNTPGWQWYNQVELSGHLLHQPPTLYDLQSYCLSVVFLGDKVGVRACWRVVGSGVRLAQDMGAHRSRPTITPETEMIKRACWILILYDSVLSLVMGRSPILDPYDIDITTPIVCDDEYWECSGSIVVFRQPPNEPSTLSAFNAVISLNRLIHFSTTMLYSTSHSPMRNNIITEGRDKWEVEVVNALDDALDTWFSSLPEHLTWDPERYDDIFFDQSAALHCMYYNARILIHRPFIPAVRSSDPTGLPSVDICNSAARACLLIAEVQQRRRPNNPLLFSRNSIFTSGIVLLLNMWGGHRMSEQDENLAGLHRCINILKFHRKRYINDNSLAGGFQTQRHSYTDGHPPTGCVQYCTPSSLPAL
ncbi:fungal-specific transcription factor domain-containing protein [Mycena rebaudengoi]|nr:fungal-specific transcription factor domain-containing protein [Mycena rebaudengoi]